MYNNRRVRTLEHFCESTSLHGYNYLSNGKSISQKIFWVIVITTMTATGVSLLIQNTGDFVDSRIITTIDSSSAPLDVSTLILGLSNIFLSVIMINVCIAVFRRWFFHLLPFAT
jgi:hypothetical protein